MPQTINFGNDSLGKGNEFEEEILWSDKKSKTLAQLLSSGTLYLSLLRNINLTLKHNRRGKFIAATKG